MSEFTNGLLFLSRDAGRVAPALEQAEAAHQIRSLNPKWSVALFADLDGIDTGAVRAVSEQAPLLHFWHAEDHGWGYTVLHHGEVQATLEVSYELLYNGAVAVFEEAYPGEDTLDEEGNPRPEFEALMAELEQSPEYIQAVQEQYAEAHPEALALFELAPEIVVRLSEVLTAEYGGAPGDQVETFKQLLGIEDMSWMQYDSARG